MLVLHIYIYIHTYITRLISNEMFSPSNKTHREVGRAKDLSAPPYLLIYGNGDLLTAARVCYVCFYSCAMPLTTIKDRYCVHLLSKGRNSDSSIRDPEDSSLHSTDGAAVYTSYYSSTVMIIQISWYHLNFLLNFLQR